MKTGFMEGCAWRSLRADMRANMMYAGVFLLATIATAAGRSFNTEAPLWLFMLMVVSYTVMFMLFAVRVEKQQRVLNGVQ